MKALEQETILSSEEKQLLAEIKDTVCALLPGARVVLYESAARGTRHSESDYDILVVTPKSLTAREEESVWDAVFEEELASGTMISTQFCSRKEWKHHRVMPFCAEIGRDDIEL